MSFSIEWELSKGPCFESVRVATEDEGDGRDGFPYEELRRFRGRQICWGREGRQDATQCWSPFLFYAQRAIERKGMKSRDLTDKRHTNS